VREVVGETGAGDTAGTKTDLAALKSVLYKCELASFGESGDTEGVDPRVGLGGASLSCGDNALILWWNSS
jgi:hypothetical protein